VRAERETAEADARRQVIAERNNMYLLRCCQKFGFAVSNKKYHADRRKRDEVREEVAPHDAIRADRNPARVVFNS
jgi:hypothetical protein